MGHNLCIVWISLYIVLDKQFSILYTTMWTLKRNRSILDYIHTKCKNWHCQNFI